MAKNRQNTAKSIEALTHDEAKRKNIPTAEHQSLVDETTEAPVEVAYQRRNRDLDPQLVWRGKDAQDASNLTVNAPPLYIQEKVHPKALIDDLRRQSVISGQWRVNSEDSSNHSSLSTHHSNNPAQPDLFGDFNGLPKDADRTAFYQFDANWQNRMILGDSLQVMASLAEKEGLRGQVQCIYLDPPYGIKFNSNFQWSTTSRDVKDGKAEHITREPEQVKAFRDTWKDGIHSYLTYLRDRLTVARDLLHESGSIFVQIGDENVHRVRALLDEVFGETNFVSEIILKTTSGAGSPSGGTVTLAGVHDTVVWYAKNLERVKYRQLYSAKSEMQTAELYRRVLHSDGSSRRATSTEMQDVSKVKEGCSLFRPDNLTSQSSPESATFPVNFHGRNIKPGKGGWKTNKDGFRRLAAASRLYKTANWSLQYIRKLVDFDAVPLNDVWTDVGTGSFTADKVYIVQTNLKIAQRCILMCTDPGDLILDPTCGSGTTATVAEQWGRRWITIDTSRVALALARARIMGARYPWYLLADSPEGQQKEAEITRSAPSTAPTRGDIRQGFVYERVPHITLKSIANNAEIDVIWERFQATLEPLREKLNAALGESWQEWEIPRESGWRWSSVNRDLFLSICSDWDLGRNAEANDSLAILNRNLGRDYTLDTLPRDSADLWPQEAERAHADWWQQRIARQQEIDASIAAKADAEYLYDKPYTDKKRVRVAGPFTVESISPHRTLGVDENDELIDPADRKDIRDGDAEPQDFVAMILDNLRTAGVQQAHKDGAIEFTSLTPWPGDLICAVGTYQASEEWAVDSEEQGNALSTNHSSLTTENRAAIFIGPEFGTVSRPDLVDAAREAADADFDVLICCAFNYAAHTTEFEKLGRMPVLKARMNADLHMATDLKNTGGGNLFVIFGEPDITVASEEWLVDSGGRPVAPYEIFKLISGTDSLAEINELDREHLRDYARLSVRREIWDYIANATGLRVDSREYRGGSGQTNHGRISAIAWDCARLSRGTGDLPELVREAGLSGQSGFRELTERLHRNQQDAKRSDADTIHSPLTTIHYAQVRIHGVDVFHPNTGKVQSDGPEGIACWFIDTDYDSESFFVRHAYFLGAADPYKSLRTTLKAEINEEAWDTLHSDTSRAFDKPSSGRIAVKVINHLGDEVMKVFRT